MFWDIVKLLVSFGIGFYLFTFGGLQILIVLRCAIPATKYLAKTYIVDKKYIYSRCAVTCVFWLVVLIALSAIVLAFFGAFVRRGFFAGMLICFLFSIGKCGINTNNLNDYFSVYREAFDPEDLEEILGAKDRKDG